MSLATLVGIGVSLSVRDLVRTSTSCEYIADVHKILLETYKIGACNIHNCGGQPVFVENK